MAPTIPGDDDLTLPASLEAISAASPLVNAITNNVTVGDVANVILHWNGLPVMSDDEREVAEMLAAAQSCLINMGTVDEAGEETMVTAAQAANEQGIPVVLDPVGVGATPTRTAVATRIVEETDVAIINGNYGEIAALAGDDAEVRGVESVGEYGEIAEISMACARATGAVVVASGATDIVADATRAYEVDVGDPMMGEFVGTGCMQGGSLAAFAGALQDTDTLATALAGTTAYGLAGERAADHGEWNGAASYRIAFLDAIDQLDAETINPGAVTNRITELATTE